MTEAYLFCSVPVEVFLELVWSRCLLDTACANGMVEEACQASIAALHKCKQSLGLLPRQCYPPSGYSGACDAAEYELKRCMAYAVSPRDAALLYNAKAPRAARVDANARLQQKLKRFHKPCTP